VFVSYILDHTYYPRFITVSYKVRNSKQSWSDTRLPLSERL